MVPLLKGCTPELVVIIEAVCLGPRKCRAVVNKFDYYRFRTYRDVVRTHSDRIVNNVTGYVRTGYINFPTCDRDLKENWFLLFSNLNTCPRPGVRATAEAP